MMKMNPFKLTEKVTISKVRRRMLDVLLNIGIPFNRWLGMRLLQVSEESVVVASPDTVLRQNHVGGAHACALALIGEYAAGVLVAQHYSFDEYRIIIGSLDVQYHKQGRGPLVGTVSAPEIWPKLTQGEAWVEMKTEITNSKAEVVAVCTTKWQVKAWSKVQSHRSA
jgi:acyl-coenzyme A thioesterase PaaI-like protein